MVHTLRQRNIRNKRVLVRVDFNVPLTKRGSVADDTRIRAALPTIKYLLAKNATVILVSHLGRPKGVDKRLRLDAIGKQLSKLLRKKVIKLDDCIGHDVEMAVQTAPKGSVILLENVRFYPEEKKNDARFAQHLARLGQVYVNDAFGDCHRAHASVDAITKYLPGAAGLLLEKEIKVLGSLLKKPKRPFVAVLGGAKVSSKIGIIQNLLKKADAILIGGAMMFTFARARKQETGRSLVETDKVALAKTLLKKGKGKIILPIDALVAKALTKKAASKNVSMSQMPKSMIGVDIGPETIAIYSQILKNAKTIVWNGPMGVFEIPKFAKGTKELARALAKSKAFTVVGGGESEEAIDQVGVAKKISHISTGGGAALEFLAGKTLPGIAALKRHRLKKA